MVANNPELHKNESSVEDLESFEKAIKSQSQRAQAKCMAIFERNNRSILAKNLEVILEERIYPVLEIIGFERWAVKVIFHIAAGAWASIAPAHRKTIHIFPVLQRQIDEIRLGVISDAANAVSWPFHFNISWIVLPRAYKFLEVTHSRYLLFYTKLLKGKEAVEFLKIVIRVVTEFLANFALKYPEQPKRREVWAVALFYAYVSMFWKNLLHHPSELEDALVFECFFGVAKRICENFVHESHLLQKELSVMQKAKEELFVCNDLIQLERNSLSEPWKLAISLRHGRAGIRSCLRFFGPGAELLGKKTAAGLAYSGVPAMLNGLLRELRRRWSSIDLKMKQSVKLFLTMLEQMYAADSINTTQWGGMAEVQIRYVRSRVLILIRKFRNYVEL